MPIVVWSWLGVIACGVIGASLMEIVRYTVNSARSWRTERRRRTNH